jgi:DNA helicase-2/ATP-dependent DNA helicase PcrA
MNKHSTRLNQFLEQELNAAQRAAVEQSSGSLLVIAGAGSGKTRVITARIAHLILNEGVEPAAIVALTFTNKAATEMLERVSHFLGPDSRKPFVGTFHGYCLRILKENIALLNKTSFSILDSDDQHKIISTIIARNNLNKKTTVQQLLHYISAFKNQLLTPDKAGSSMSNIQWVKEAYTAYEAEKKASNCYDFDDLLFETLALFKKHSAFKQLMHNRVRHILVDEYQDTNTVQHELLKHMAKHNKQCAIDSICAVGDEDQSIYSWRGATVANMITFKDDFAPTTVVKLEQNYRSVQPILEVANKVIKHNKYRNPKNLWSDRAGSDRIRSIVCLSDYQESETIALCIRLATKTHKRSDIAILYRTHFQSRSLEEGLLKNSIPYKIVGGTQFYERKEIKDLLAYLRLIVNPFDRPAFFRVINCPARSLGTAFEELVHTLWKAEPFLTFPDLARKLIDNGSVTGVKKTSLLAFLATFEGLTPQTSPSQALDTIIKRIDYFGYLKKSCEEQEAHERSDNVKELISAVHHLESTTTTVELFLHDVALMQEKKKADDESSDPVLLMTLHAAKGLEFKTVIIAGLEEGLLPSSRSINEVEKLEEERRLLYVGITRARERLLLTRCRYRYTYGKMTDQVPSRFVQEMPSNLLITQDVSHVTQQQLSTWFSQWLNPAASAPTPLPMTAKKPVTQQKKAIIPARTGTAAPRQSVRTAQPKPIAQSMPTSSWKKNQPVKHPTFGVGIVQTAQKRGSTTFVEVKFKGGLKKIAEKFLEVV